jgi:hypothetical protein
MKDCKRSADERHSGRRAVRGGRAYGGGQRWRADVAVLLVEGRAA